MSKVFRSNYRHRQYLTVQEREKIRRDLRSARDAYHEALTRLQVAYQQTDKIEASPLTERHFHFGKPGPHDQQIDPDDDPKSDQ